MIGAIIGDIVGSKYEFNNISTKKFPLFSDGCKFTDDSVMTIAVYKALKECNGNYSNLDQIVTASMQKYGKIYWRAGYGNNFFLWLCSKDPKPYNSYGNGSAMRVSPVAYFAKDIEEVKFLSEQVTKVTHNHPEGLRGAEATAVAVWLALNKKSKDEIKEHIKQNYYDLNFDYNDLRENYTFDVSCQGSVPQAIYCFLISNDFEDAIRNAISIGGDCDTTGAICGAIAGAYYGIPQEIKKEALSFLDERLLADVNDFEKTFGQK